MTATMQRHMKDLRPSFTQRRRLRTSEPQVTDTFFLEDWARAMSDAELREFVDTAQSTFDMLDEDHAESPRGQWLLAEQQACDSELTRRQ